MSLSRSKEVKDILISWASKNITSDQAAKQLAYEVDFANYHNISFAIDNSDTLRYFGVLLRTLAKQVSNEDRPELYQDQKDSK